jgi:AraC-like DNA-binding protein
MGHHSVKGPPTRQQHPLSHEGYADLGKLVTGLSHSRGTEDPPVMHVHEAAEVGIVLDGKVTIDYGSCVVEYGPGELWLVAMWEQHERLAEPAGAVDVVLIFLPEFVAEEAAGMPSLLNMFALPPPLRPQPSSGADRELVLAIGRDLKREVDGRHPAWTRVVQLTLTRLLIECSRWWDASAASVGSGDAAAAATLLARIMPALSLVYDDPKRRLSVTEAADVCSLSRSRFQHIFRSAMGVSFGSFSQRLRLAFCAHRLLTTDHTTEAIAAEAGFAGASHLNRGFLKQYGCTAGQFRRTKGVGSL